MLKNLAKITLVFALFAFIFMAKPAKAFWFEPPQIIKDWLASLKNNKTIAQEEPVMTPPPTDSTAPMPPQDGTYQQPIYQTQPMPTSDQGYQQQPQPMPVYDQNYQQPPMNNGNQTCNINGKEMPGPCDQYNNQGSMQGGQGQGGPSPEQQARQLKDMKRGALQSERMIKEFERMIQKVEKAGTTVPDEIKQKLEKLKSIVESSKKATTMEEMQDVDMSEMGDIMQSMDEFRRDVVEKQQRMGGMKRGMKGMEQGLKMFKSQIARLTKQKIVVPPELSDNIAKLEAIIAQVKTAKTSEEIDAIDFESMQGLMQSLDENRQQLEVLARWPQTLKQMNQEITRLERKLKSDKTIVDRLLKKGIDLQSVFASFQEAITKLKAVRDDAVSKIAAGNSQDAFDAIETDFFGQMEDVWQGDKVIMMMSNLGRFNSDFKRGVSQAQSVIKNLNRKKIDTSELQSILDQVKVKGQEVLDMIKSKDLDEDTVSSAMDELENLRQEFSDKVSDLTGQEDIMPWEKGPQQFKQVQMSPDVQRYMPQRQESQMPQNEQAPMQPPTMGPSGF